MAQYAKHTTVPVEKSQSEIRNILLKYKAEGFACGWEGNLDCLSWTHKGVHYIVRMPRPAQPQAHRQRWRAMRLVIYAKLEAVECGISTVEREFMAWAMGPDGKTIGDIFEGKMLDWSKQGPRMLMLPPPPTGATQ